MAQRRNKARKIREVLGELGPDAKVAQVVDALNTAIQLNQSAG